MTDITALAQLRAELSNPAIGNKDHLRKIALSLVEALEKAQTERDVFRRRFNLERSILEDADKDLETLRQRIVELEDAEQKLCAANVTLDARAELAERHMAGLEPRTVTAAAVDVLAERQRQVSAEGWTAAHDDEYEHGELADAAGCYALSSELFDCAGEPPRPWPWSDEWWKPTSRRRDLVKAGALILAEIERIDRAATLQTKSLTTINHAPALVSLPKKGESLSGSSPVNDVTAGKQLTNGDVVTSLDRQSVDHVDQSSLSGNSPVIPDRWIPVSERLPEIRKGWLDIPVIIAVLGEKDGAEAMYFSDGKFRWGRDEPPIEDVTHWMPLPVAPQEVK